jgi:hypothetical protein
MSTQNLIDDAKRWLEWLRDYHVGLNNGVTVKDMFESGGMDSILFNIPTQAKHGTYINNLVSYLRYEEGYPICVKFHGENRGHFWPETIEEARKYCTKMLRDRAISGFINYRKVQGHLADHFPEHFNIINPGQVEMRL